MSRSRTDAQNDFHEHLTRYVNGAFASRSDLLLSLAAPGAAFRREAPYLCRAFRESARRDQPATASAQVLQVPAYTGTTPQVSRCIQELESMSTHLAGACVHGSIATGEEIAYSDFDALVILRDRVFDSPATLAAVAGQLSGLRRIMLEYDPLQHHGWFVLTESDLRDYCQAWFPAVLFPWSRALLPASGLKVQIHARDSTGEYRAAFSSLADGTLRRIESGPPPANAYRLKGLLSQFMLLPSLYLQARDGTAVFKKESFAIAAQDFSADLWSAMDQVSEVRLRWHYQLTTMQRIALTRGVRARRLLTRWLQPQVPVEILGMLGPDTWQRAAGLVRAMQSRIGVAGS